MKNPIHFKLVFLTGFRRCSLAKSPVRAPPKTKLKINRVYYLSTSGYYFTRKSTRSQAPPAAQIEKYPILRGANSLI